MSNFLGSYDTLDTFAFRAAVEAVLGVTLAGKQANQEMSSGDIVRGEESTESAGAYRN